VGKKYSIEDFKHEDIPNVWFLNKVTWMLFDRDWGGANETILESIIDEFQYDQGFMKDIGMKNVYKSEPYVPLLNIHNLTGIMDSEEWDDLDMTKTQLEEKILSEKHKFISMVRLLNSVNPPIFSE
jgi:hypothetical protein